MDRIEIAGELQSVALVSPRAQRPRDGGVVHRLKQVVVHAVGNAEQRFAADTFEHRLERIDQQQHAEEADQGGYAAAGQYGIVNQQHVARTREHEHVKHYAGDRDKYQRAAVAPDEQPHKLTI